MKAYIIKMGNKIDLHRIIQESLRKVIFEGDDRYEKWYRGYDSRYGSSRNHLLWITDDMSYAGEYGDSIEEIILDSSRLHLVSLYDMDELLGHEIDYYVGPNRDDVEVLLSQGYNGYGFEANDDMSYCVCLFSDDAIVSRRVISSDEYRN